MITSLKFLKVVNVSVGSGNKFKIGSGEPLDVREIPAVRYYFNDYGDEEIQFISQMMSIFKHSVHVVEFDAHKPETYEKVTTVASNLAFIAHLSINNRHADEHDFNEDEINVLSALKMIPLNRIMLNDTSTNLDYIGLATLIKKVKEYSGMSEKNIGCCNSPYTDSNNCCMSAALAREWSAKYNHVGEGALPSANHNNKDCGNCGCLRYELVTEDIIAVVSDSKKSFMNPPSGNGGSKKKTEKSDSGETGDKAPKPKKTRPVW